MTVVIALDDKNGFSFNHRRQSRDEALTKRLMEMKVNIEDYSYEIFPKSYIGNSDSYFIEKDLSKLHTADKLVVFRWNRIYPSDIKADLSEWRKISESEFAGKSHDKITEEHYEKI